MKRLSIALALATGISGLGLQAAPMAMDAARGRDLFTSRGCVQCHKLGGQGGTKAPDLSRVVDRGFTPAMMASTLWNHAPVMWSAMKAQNITPPPLSEQDAADLFAAFYAARYFDVAADAGRGKKVFVDDACARCHGLETSPVAAAPPVRNWAALNNSVSLVADMWNHAANMQAQLQKQKVPWPVVSGQELADLLIYLRNQPATSGHQDVALGIGAPGEGEALFKAKGCTSCHEAGRLKTGGMTLNDVAAALWNHASRLKDQRPTFNEREMSALLGFVWSAGFFRDAGDPVHGQKVFAQRQCVQCHGAAGSNAPDLLAKGGLDGISIVSALWRHGPTMLELMKSRNIKWPEFRSGEMADLLAYVNSAKKK